jgi:hypothetical protein
MRATDAAVVRLEVANASDQERSLSVIGFTDPSDAQASSQFDALTRLIALPGFEAVRAGELATLGPAVDPTTVQSSMSRLVFRDRVCEHLTILSGRCLVGTGEIVIGSQTAKRTGLAPGDVATMQAYKYNDNGVRVADGNLAPLTVVGVYDPTDESDPYWGSQRYFPLNADGTRQEAVFTTVGTLSIVGHSTARTMLDAYAPAPVLTAQRLAGLPDEITRATSNLSDLSNFSVVTSIPDLAARVANSDAQARKLGPVAFIPLAALSIFVIYLAVAYGMAGRRPELALIALRGASGRRRWALATGETVAAIAAGSPVGYLLGYLCVGLVARARLGSADGTQLSWQALPDAGVALLVALAVALLGQRRALREPVVELLRGVPRARGAWQALALEVLVVALAIVATLQLRVSTDGFTGLGLLVPGLVVMAMALLAARVDVAATGVFARLALRRGMLGAGLSAVQLARRPGSQRLFVLLAVGTGLLSFVAAGTDVAARAREDRATVVTGAPRVLTIQGASARRVLAATDKADPDGTWAMAAQVLTSSDPAEPTILALDTRRLAAVGYWRSEFGASPQQVAGALAPPQTPSLAPFRLTSTTLSVDVEVARDNFGSFGRQDAQAAPAELDLVFATADGGRAVAVLSGLQLGRHTVTAAVPGCDGGCRLTGLAAPNMSFDLALHIYAVRQLDPPAEVVPTDQLLNAGRWRSDTATLVGPSGQSLTMRTRLATFSQNGSLHAGVLGATTPVPVAATAGRHLGPRLRSLDDQPVDAKQVLTMTMLPRLGSSGVLADIRYLEQTLVSDAASNSVEIWLGASAPADPVATFRALGLAVTGGTTVADARGALARQGPALALQFYVAAAAFGMALALGGLGLVAAVDRKQRAADLRALRVQGLPRRMARRAALWGYLSIVLLAALTGLVGAAVAWIASGDRLPIFTDTASPLTPPHWPGWQAVAQPWAAATVALAAAAVFASWALRRAIVRGNGSGGAR